MLNFNAGNHIDDQLIFELTPFPMWIYDLETFRFLKVNKEAIRHYGYSEAEFLNMTIKDIRPKEDVPKLEKAVKEARNRTEPYKESLFRHQKRDGSIIYVQIKSNLIDFKGRKADIVSAVDLTERYEHERAIKAQQKYLKAIGTINQLLLKNNEWQQSLDACFNIVGETIDVDRIYYFHNNQHQQTTSQQIEWTRYGIEAQIDNPTLQEVPYSKFTEILEPLEKQRHFEAIVEELPPSSSKRILEEQNIKSLLILPIWGNNDFCGFIGFDDCRNKRSFNEDEFRLLHTLTSNVGHLIKKHEIYQELSDRESRFKALIENGKELIAIIDENGNYKYLAPTTKTILGFAPEELVGKNAFDFIYEDDIPPLEKQLQKILNSKYVLTEPYRFPDAEGNWHWIQTELTNHLKTPLIKGIVANTQEVTEEVEKRMVNELVVSLTLIIGQSGSLASCLNEALNRLVKLSRISVAEIWLVSPDDIQLDLIAKACQDNDFQKFYQNANDVTSLERGKGFPGHIWKELKTTSWKNISKNKRFLRSKSAKAANLNTGIGLPILYNNQFVGCIICFSQFKEDQLSGQISLLKKVSQQLGVVVKQKVTSEEYRNFFNISPDLHCIIGYDGNIKKFNKAFRKLLGYKEKDLLNKSIFQFIHPDDKRKSIEKLKEYVERMDGINPIEARFLNKKGDIKWLVWKGTAIPESKMFITVAKDITEYKHAEQQLNKAYEQLKRAQKIAKLGYWVREFDTDTTVWSEETYAIYGFSPQNFVPTMEKVTKAFHPDDRYLIESAPTDHLEIGKIQSFEHRIITGTNKVKWVHQEMRIVPNENGVPVRIEGTIQDITERKKYEEQLSLSNERFKLAMQASNEMIWEIDHIKQIVRKGKTYKQTFKYVKKEPFSKEDSWFTQIHIEDRDRVWNSLNKALLNKKKKSWKAEYRVQLSDGSIVYFVDRCYIIRDKEGNPIRSVGSVLDVTASRQQLERIKKQNEKLREIAWQQSHVIRSPLSKIMGLIYLSQEHGGGGLSNKDIMELITESAHELDEVIRDITDKTQLIKDEEVRNFTD